eukprot:9485456-Pyramimonas_sp.AAC.1
MKFCRAGLAGPQYDSPQVELGLDDDDGVDLGAELAAVMGDICGNDDDVNDASTVLTSDEIKAVSEADEKDIQLGAAALADLEFRKAYEGASAGTFGTDIDDIRDAGIALHLRDTEPKGDSSGSGDGSVPH